MQRSLIVLLAASIPVFFSIGCSTPSRYGDSSDIYSSGSRGFTKEMDEPSARGLLSRVTPEEHDVQLSFCFSPVTKDLVFSASTSSDVGKLNAVYNLWKIPANGGAPVKLTSGGEEHCLSPSYTPDGKYIVYASMGKLWKIRENGAGGRLKLDGSGLGYDFAPKVSSKGKIVFCSSSSKITPYSATPSYGSTRGSRSYSSTTGLSAQKTCLWICEADGGNLTQMREGESPVWTPDGNAIVFSYERDLWMMNADGTSPTQLTTTSEYHEGCPSVSSDGAYVLFASNESNKKGGMVNDFNIWKMKLDAAEKTQLTELESWDAWPLMTDGVLYFSSGRATKDKSERAQRIWKIKLSSGADGQAEAKAQE